MGYPITVGDEIGQKGIEVGQPYLYECERRLNDHSCSFHPKSFLGKSRHPEIQLCGLAPSLNILVPLAPRDAGLRVGDRATPKRCFEHKKKKLEDQKRNFSKKKKKKKKS